MSPGALEASGPPADLPDSEIDLMLVEQYHPVKHVVSSPQTLVLLLLLLLIAACVSTAFLIRPSPFVRAGTTY